MRRSALSDTPLLRLELVETTKRFRAFCRERPGRSEIRDLHFYALLRRGRECRAMELLPPHVRLYCRFHSNHNLLAPIYPRTKIAKNDMAWGGHSRGRRPYCSVRRGFVIAISPQAFSVSDIPCAR
jgi:hypothetical protein